MLQITRFVFVVLLLALLPLRGWAGNVMAISMATGMAANSAAHQTQVEAAASQASMPADCPLHAQALAAEAPGAALPGETVAAQEPAAPYCSSCDTCELCLAVANPAAAVWASGQSARHSAPLAFNQTFTSAASASNLKPPIF